MMETNELLIKLTQQTTEINGSVKAVHKRLDGFEKDVKDTQTEIKKTIYGNAQPGLTTRVSLVESRIKLWGSIGAVILTSIILAYFGLN
ncbi:MAG: hypothetical protein ACE5HI_07435 [bacterium]